MTINWNVHSIQWLPLYAQNTSKTSFSHSVIITRNSMQSMHFSVRTRHIVTNMFTNTNTKAHSIISLHHWIIHLMNYWFVIFGRDTKIQFRKNVITITKSGEKNRLLTNVIGSKYSVCHSHSFPNGIDYVRNENLTNVFNMLHFETEVERGIEAHILLAFRLHGTHFNFW